MSPGTSSEVKLEIGHVLFIDVVGYSQLLITQQSEHLETLRRIVRDTAQFQATEAEGIAGQTLPNGLQSFRQTGVSIACIEQEGFRLTIEVKRRQIARR